MLARAFVGPILPAVLFLMGCGPSLSKMKQEAEQALEAASQSVDPLQVDTVRLAEAVSKVNAFVQQFPDDASCPELLYRLGIIQQQSAMAVQAVRSLQQVYQRYPSSPLAHKALFLEAFIHANELNDIEKAKVAYELYLTHYSHWDEKMTQDARFELEHLGKSPEEVLQHILKAQPQATR